MTTSLGARRSQHIHCSLKRDHNNLYLLTESFTELFINSRLLRIQCQLQCQNPKSALLSMHVQSSRALQQINVAHSEDTIPSLTHFPSAVLILAALSANKP